MLSQFAFFAFVHRQPPSLSPHLTQLALAHVLTPLDLATQNPLADKLTSRYEPCTYPPDRPPR